MKNIILLLAISTLFLFSACEENIDSVPLNMGGNTEEPVDPVDRKVLVEEFTGVRCVNCPTGAEKIEDLIALHGKRVIAISIHTGGFAFPFTGQEDYKIDEGEDLLNHLGGEFGFPAASINRKVFDGETNQQGNLDFWGSYVAQELEEVSPIVLEIETNYATDGRELDVTLSFAAAEAISEKVYVSVMITENNIVGPQLTLDGEVDDYKHKHVLRGMLTDATGDLLSEGIAANASFEEDYSYVLPEGWIAENCKVVAAVHFNENMTDVIQAGEADVVE